MFRLRGLLAFSAALLFTLTSCVQTQQLVTPMQADAAVEEVAEVFIMRRAAPGWFNSRADVFIDGKIVGFTGPKGYLGLKLAPGKYELSSSSGTFSYVDLEVEAGETYYFKQSLGIAWGQEAPAVELVQLSEEKGQELLEKMEGPKFVSQLQNKFWSNSGR